MTECSVDGCTKSARSSKTAYCEMHYYRLRRTGTLEIITKPQRPPGTCTVDGCTKPRCSLGYCQMHYSRMRRNGSVEQTRPWSPTTGQCPVEGCEKPQNYNGMCKLHASRVARHGDPFAYTSHRERNLARGEANPNWTGSNATYSAIHQRLPRVKGRAADHPCAECGGNAKQWSYDHADPDERTSEFGPYSTDLDRYIPRCVPCHKTLDLEVNPPKRSPVDLDEVRRLHAAGVRVAAMARQLGVGRERVNYALTELGLPRFGPGSPGKNLAVSA